MATQLVTVKQAAALLGVSSNTIYNLIHAGRIPHFRVGLGRGTIRIEKADVEKMKIPAIPEVCGLRHLADAG